MTAPTNPPSDRSILVKLLHFFAASAEEQMELLKEYCRVAQEMGDEPHLDSPLIELASGFVRYREPRDWAPELLPTEANLVEEIGYLLLTMLETKSDQIFTAEALRSIALWRLVRRLSAQLLGDMSTAPEVPLISMWELMCYITD